MKTFALILFAAIAGGRFASAQAVSVGVKGGVPLLDGTTFHDESRPYIVGPMIEVRLPADFAIEVDALYRRIGSSYGFSGNIVTGTGLTLIAPYSGRQRGNAWEFPFLGKYYFHQEVKGGRVFVGTGWALRTIDFRSVVSQSGVDSSGRAFTQTFKNHDRSDVQVGAVVAAGFRFQAGRFALAPEARYTRWGNSTGSSSKNEASLLLGISF